MAGACRRSYLARGLNGDFDLSGSYDVQAQPTTNRCAEVLNDVAGSRLDVQHVPGNMQLTIVFEGDAYPAKVRRDGSFAADEVRRSRGGAVERVAMRGRFTSARISASLEVNRMAVRTVLPTSRTYTTAACSYHVNVAGSRIVEEGR